jgi:hypothetical protein
MIGEQRLKQRIKEISGIYGVPEAKIREIISSFPAFAGLNHSRVMGQALSLGKLIGLKKADIIAAIFERPVLVGYSKKRNLAAIDAFRNALRDSGVQRSNKELFELYKQYYSSSPYPVEGSKKRETFWRRQKKESISAMGNKVRRRLSR